MTATPEAGEGAVAEDGGRSPGRRGAFVRRHAPFVLIVTVGVLLRVGAMLGYRWHMWFTDSYEYVYFTLHLRPYGVRPSGYSLFLRTLLPLHDFGVVTAVQHLMGLACAVLPYLVAMRYRARPWLAAVALAPILLDAYEIQLEHLLLSDSLFMFMLVAAVALTMWRTAPGDLPPWWAMAVSGLAVGVAAVTRSVGLPLLLVFCGYLAIRWVVAARARRSGPGSRPSWPRLLLAGLAPIVAVSVAGALPIAAYAAWYKSVHGTYGFSGSGGVFLYARTMAFADCSKMRPPPDLRPLCDPTPVAQRPSSQFYMWSGNSPLRRPSEQWVFAPANNDRANRFAKLAIRSQPKAYLRTVVDDTLHAFSWHRTVFPDLETYEQYRFRTNLSPAPRWVVPTLRQYDPDWATVVMEPYAGMMRAYQRWGYVPGTLLGVGLLAGAAGIVARWRIWRTIVAGNAGVAAGGRRREEGAALLPWTMAVALIVLPAMTADFSYRYLIPAFPLAGLALALTIRRTPRGR